MGRRKKDTGYFQIFYLHICRVAINAGRYFVYLFSYKTHAHFRYASFYKAALTTKEQNWLFWLFFIAFAIKMPIFPFHTWQPDTYEQSPTATTMVLSGVMVKMGVFGLIRWLLPCLPLAAYNWATLVISFCVTGMIYASLIAIQQDDLKRLVAYSSIAHIGLMCAASFCSKQQSVCRV